MLKLRIRTGELMVALCDKRETEEQAHFRQRAHHLHQGGALWDHYPLLMDQRQCLRYIGDETVLR